MTSVLTPTQVQNIKADLLRLLSSLQDEVKAELADRDGARKLAGVGETHDLDDEARADVDLMVNVTQITRHLQEVRECEAALERLTAGEYGLCRDCGEQIELNRLKANPVSTRCLACQSLHEQQSLQVAAS